MCQGIVIQSKLVPINIGLTPDHFLSIQDRQPICELPGDVRNDQSLQSQIEEAASKLIEAKDGKDVHSNLLKAPFRLILTLILLRSFFIV